MNSRHRHAFALVESIVTVLTLAVMSCLLLVAASHDRSLGWQTGSIANLHEFATGTASYAADNTDQFWSYSWLVGVPTPSLYPDLHVAPTDIFERSGGAGGRHSPPALGRHKHLTNLDVGDHALVR